MGDPQEKSYEQDWRDWETPRQVSTGSQSVCHPPIPADPHIYKEITYEATAAEHLLQSKIPSLSVKMEALGEPGQSVRPILTD